MAYSVSDFAARIRSKYPDAYDSFGDDELVARWLKKYPGYAESIDFGAKTGGAPTADFNAAHRSTVGKPFGDDGADQSISAVEGGQAVGGGVLQGLGIHVPDSAREYALDTLNAMYPPAAAASQSVAMIQNAMRYGGEARSAKSKTGTVTKAIGVVPVLGPPVSDLLQPSTAAVEGRPATRDENLDAIKAGASLGTMMAVPKAMERVGSMVGRRQPELATPADVSVFDTGADVGPITNVEARNAEAGNLRAARSERDLRSSADDIASRAWDDATLRSDASRESDASWQAARADAELRAAANQAVSPGNDLREPVNGRVPIQRETIAKPRLALPAPEGRDVYVDGETASGAVKTFVPNEPAAVPGQRPFTDRNRLDVVGIVRRLGPDDLASAKNIINVVATETGKTPEAATGEVRGLIEKGIIVPSSGGGFELGIAPTFLEGDISTPAQIPSRNRAAMSPADAVRFGAKAISAARSATPGDIGETGDLLRTLNDARDAQFATTDHANGQTYIYPKGAANGRVADVIEKYAGDLRNQVASQTEASELRRLAYENELTGLPNRRAWNETPRRAAIASIDLDNLKPVNDVYGHGAGDSLIAANADVLRQAAAESGIDIAHISGDEFKAQHDHPELLADGLNRANDLLRQRGIEYVNKDGSTVLIPQDFVKGFSYGIGRNEFEAEAALKASKSAREAAGIRRRRSDVFEPRSGGLPEVAGSEAGRQVPPSPIQSAQSLTGSELVDSLPGVESPAVRQPQFEPMTDAEAEGLGLGRDVPTRGDVPEWRRIGIEPKGETVPPAPAGGPPSGGAGEPPLFRDVPRPEFEGPEYLPLEPVHRNAIVKGAADIYNRAFPTTPDAIERQGPHGAIAAQLIRGARRTADQRSSGMLRAIETATKGLTPEEWDQVGAIRENEVPAGKVSPRVPAAVRAVEQVMNSIRDLATRNVDDFVPLDAYLPHFGKRPETMPESVQQLAVRVGHESYNLTRERGENSARPQGLDLKRAIEAYVKGSNRYVSELEAFGVKNRGQLDQKLEGMSKLITASGYDGDILKRYGSTVLGGGSKADRINNWVANNVVSLQSITKTPFAGFRHIHQLAFDAPELGVGNTIAALGDYGKYIAGSPEMREVINDSGVLMRNAAFDLFGGAQNRDVFSAALRNVAVRANVLTTLVDTQKAVLTGLAARRRFGELTDLVNGKAVSLFDRASGDLRPSQAIVEDAWKQLRRAGVTKRMLASPEGEYQGMVNFIHTKVHDIQRGTTAADSQAYSQTPSGRMLYWAQRPAAFGVDFTLNRIIRPAASGNFRPLAAFLMVGPIVNYLAEKVPSYAGGRKPAAEEIFDRLVGGSGVSGSDIASAAAETYTPHGLVRHGAVSRASAKKMATDLAMNYSGAYGATLGDADAIAQAIQRGDIDPVLGREMHLKYGKKLLKNATDSLSSQDGQ